MDARDRVAPPSLGLPLGRLALAGLALLTSCALSSTRAELVRCRSDSECPVGLVCLIAQHACVECVDAADCGPGDVCLGTHCERRVDCTTDAACGTMPCDPGAGHCVECLAPSDCAAGDACSAGGCVAPVPPECASASECHAGERCEAGLCVAPPIETPTVVSVGAGLHFACAALSSGAVHCWGENTAGQLGDGTMTERHAAGVPVVGIDDAVSVAVGAQHACALRAGGQIACWGYGPFGTLGEGTGASSAVPVAVTGLRAPATHVSCGLNVTCAALADGTVASWGDDTNGISGDGTTGGMILEPATVSGIDDATLVVVGVDHACAVRADGAIGCWGGGYDGQLGDGGRGPRAEPFWVGSGESVGLSYTATCARTGGTLACWGHVMPTFEIRDVPTAIAGLGDAVEVEGGLDAMCARRASGAVTCWGSNSAGQLGVEGVGRSEEPIGAVFGLEDAVDIDLGAGFGCAIRRTGVLVCWGTNPRGELGDGSSVASTRPVVVAGLE